MLFSLGMARSASEQIVDFLLPGAVEHDRGPEVGESRSLREAANLACTTDVSQVVTFSWTHWMVSPKWVWRTRWDICVQVLIVFQSVMVPFELAFFEDPLLVTYAGWLVIEIFVTLIFLADMVLNFRTGVLRNGEVDWDSKLAMRNYLTTWFALDFVAWLPSALALLMSPFESDAGGSRSSAVVRLGRSVRFFRTLRMLRIIQLVRVAHRDEAAHFMHRQLLRSRAMSAALRLGQVFLVAALCMHLSACLWAAVAPMEQHLEAEQLDELAPVSSRYLFALWWASCSLTLGGHPSPRGDGERVLALFLNILNILFLGTAFAFFFRIAAGLEEDNQELVKVLTAASRFSVKHRLPTDLWVEIHRQVARSALGNHNERQFKEIVAGTLSENLCHRIFGSVYGQILRRFPPFAQGATLFPGSIEAPEEFICQLAYDATLTTAEAGDIVCRRGEKATTMVFIVEGSLELRLDDKTIKYSRGYWFGELAILFDYLEGSSRSSEKQFCWKEKSYARKGDIFATGPCKLLSLEKEAFKAALKRFDLFDIWLKPIIEHVRLGHLTFGCQCCLRNNHLLHECGNDDRIPQLGKLSVFHSIRAPRPQWLPVTGPGNMNVSPEHWGMTLSQWAAFIAACASTDKWAELEASTDRKEFGHVNLYQVCDHMVKPWTMGTGNSVALLMNNVKPLHADVMVSHAWGESVLEALVAVLARASVTGIGLGATVWFCTFAQYQPGDGPSVQEQLELDPFRKVIESRPRFGMLVVHTSTAELYGRLWCVYEVNEAQKASVVPFSAFSVDSLKKLKLLDTASNSLEEKLKVDTRMAQCFSPEDTHMITNKILNAGGFEQLDNRIIDFRMASISVIRALYQKVSDWAGNPGSSDEVLEDLSGVVRRAAMFVALHCLTQYVNDADSEMAVKMIAMAKDILEQWKRDFVRSTSPPPGFDLSKLSIEPDTRDDTQVRECLADLGKIPFATGILEWAAGGSIMTQVAKAANFDTNTASSWEPVKEAFRRWTDGSARMGRAQFRCVVKQVSINHPDHDIDLLFSIADTNRDGEIDLSDFVSWLRSTLA